MLDDALQAAEKAVFDARPRTRAGIAAQLIYAAEYIAEYVRLPRDEAPELNDQDVILPLLVNAARSIDPAGVPKIALGDRLAKMLSYADQADNET